MTLFDAIILGIIEGITEFLPISSTGHLIVAGEILGIDQTRINKAFEVIIQFAAILAVVVNYKERFTPKYISLWSKVFLAFLPIGTIGYLFASEIKTLFSIEVVAIMFIIGGVVFLAMEKLYLPKRTAHIQDLDEISYKQAFFVGLAQVFALIPGTSRAGATIIGALFIGMSRKVSAEFSFLLALPVMSAVSLYDLLKHYSEFTQENMLHLTLGFIISFLVAYVAMKLFLAFLERFTFVAFGIYRIIFGLLLLVLFI